MTTRLISVDSHVQVHPEQIKANLAQRFHAAFDDAIAADRARHVEELGGIDPKLLAAGFSHEAMTDPGYSDAAARLKAMDRDGVAPEVLPSDASAITHHSLIH